MFHCPTLFWNNYCGPFDVAFALTMRHKEKTFMGIYRERNFTLRAIICMGIYRLYFWAIYICPNNWKPKLRTQGQYFADWRGYSISGILFPIPKYGSIYHIPVPLQPQHNAQCICQLWSIVPCGAIMGWTHITLRNHICPSITFDVEKRGWNTSIVDGWKTSIVEGWKTSTVP
jgi:hypothetical protein